MAVILEERGRGKFRPVLDCDLNEVREVLNKRIESDFHHFLQKEKFKIVIEIN